MLPTVKGLVITTDGRAYPTKVGTLDDYQKIVGGYIEVVVLADGCSMYVNEEGKLDGLPVNAAATVLVPGDVIVGNVLIVGPTDDEGDDTDIPDEAAYRYTQLC